MRVKKVAVRKSPRQIRAVLEALAQTDSVIIGGQAVNLWAEKYEKDAFPWNALRPYTSFDLDVLGSRMDVLKCSQILNAQPRFPLSNENTVNSGQIVTKVDGTDFQIDFLHSPNGLSSAEIRELARMLEFDKITLKVLHPLHCVESKTVNLMTLPQNAGDRQDLKHLQLSIAVLHEYLKEMTLAGSSEQALLRIAKRIRMDSNHEFGLRVAIKHDIDFLKSIPNESWKNRPGALSEFINTEWDAWNSEIAEKKVDAQDLDLWMKKLKGESKPPMDID